MPNICAIIACPGTIESAIPCLRSLSEQKRKPDATIILSARPLRTDTDLPLLREFSDITLMQQSSPDWADAFNTAFSRLNADFVWLLRSDCTVAPSALQVLLESPTEEEVRVCLISTPSNKQQLSLPVISESGKNIFAPWHSILTRDDLPQQKHIPIRGSWFGSLYPRSVVAKIGVPCEMNSTEENNEEYAWKAKLAGIRFSLVKEAEMYAPPFSKQLIHYKIGGRSFFYEVGLSPERRYCKIRNWAWIQRLRKPGKPILRLAFCGLYAVLSLNAMLKSNELNPKGVYTLFRALHNGFYGKLRPYSSAKN